MKKNFLKILLLSLPFVVTACAPGTSSNTSSTSSDSSYSSSLDSSSENSSLDSSSEESSITDSSTGSVVTAVEINGPSTVRVGSTITLTAGVTGDRTASVSWSSSDENVATIDSNGRVTGVSVGIVTIRATSTINPDVYGEYLVEVIPVYDVPTAVTPYIEEGLGVVYDSADNVYYIEVGTQFQILYTLNVENPDTPYADPTYTVLQDQYGNSMETYISISSTGLATANYSYASIIQLQVSYYVTASTTIRGEMNVIVRDTKQESLDELASRIEDASSSEKSSAVSATVSKNSEDEYNYHYFNDAVYADYGAGSYGFNGTVDGYYYSFLYSYDANNAVEITDVVEKSPSATGNENLAYDVDNESYGVVNNIVSILTSTSYAGFMAFGNDYIVENILIDETGGEISVSSTYEYSYESTSYTYNLTLSITLDTSSRVTDYSYESEYVVTEGTSDPVHTSYTESGTITYGERTASTNYEHRVDTSSFLVNSDFTLRNIAGESSDGYNFTNPSTGAPRYLEGGANRQIEYNGKNVDVYSMPPNLSFPFKIDGVSDQRLMLDSFTVAVTPISYQVIGEEEVRTDLPVCSITQYNQGVFTCSAQFTDQGNAVMGQSAVTLTSRLGYSYTFIMEITDYPDPTSITVQMPSGVTGTDFGTIFVGQTTDQFLINTEPDTLGYAFNLNVRNSSTGETVENALELTRLSDIIAGTSGWGIRGLIAGTYTFSISIEGFSDIKTGDYTITVLEVPTEEEVKSQIVGKTYTDHNYTSSYYTCTVSFSDTEMTITQYNYGDEYTVNVPYSVEFGEIVLEGGTEVIATDAYGNNLEGTYIYLGEGTGERDNLIYRYLRTDVNITFNTDYSELYISLVPWNNNVSMTFTFDVAA